MFEPSRKPWLVTWSKPNSAAIGTRRFKFYKNAKRDLEEVHALGYYGYIVHEKDAPRRNAETRRRMAELKNSPSPVSRRYLKDKG